MIKQVIVILLVLFFVLGKAFPQNDQVKFESFSIDDGISQSTIRSIIQDQNGFIWIATQDGLNKYDGYEFTNYFFDPNQSGTLSNNFVMDLMEDSKGRLWVGTRRGGLNVFDASVEKFRSFNHLKESKLTLSNNQVQTVFEDSQQRIWIGTARGLNLFDEKKELFSHFYPDTQNHDGLGNSINAIIELASDQLLLGTSNGCYLFDIQKKTLELISKEGIAVNAFYMQQEKVWVGTVNGLLLFDQKQEKWQHVIDNIEVTSLEAYDNQWIWIGTKSKGLMTFHAKTGKLNTYSNQKGRVFTLSDNHVFDIYKDKNGALWVGTYNGLNKYDEEAHYFNALYQDPFEKNSLRNDNVRGVSTDKNGKVWIATRGGGVDIFDGEKIIGSLNKESGLPDSRAEAVYLDREGNVWIGLQTGLCRYVPESKGFSLFQTNKNTPFWKENNHVHEIFEDSKGNLWLGTLGGLNKFDRQKQSFEVFQDAEIDSLGLRGNYVRAILEDTRGFLWVGTYDGLNRFSFDKNGEASIKHYQHKTWDNNSLSYNYVRTIHEDGEGNIWVGTSGGGLNKLTVDSEGEVTNVERFSTSEGLTNNSIYGILSDEEGQLWISTNKELARFDPQKKVFRTYGIKDGLHSNEFNQGAYHKDKNGKMYFGGLGGLSIFHPKLVKEIQNEPPVVFTKFRLFGNEVPIGATEDREEPLLSQHINLTNEIRLNHDEDIFSIEFAALNFRHSEKNQYSYKMEGLDNRWHQLGNQRVAAFTGLPHGEYTLSVRVSTNDLEWSEKATKSIKIIISPPFWETNWFRGLIIFLLIALVVLLHKVRVRNIKKQKIKLEKLVDVRTKELREEKEKVEASNREVLQKNKEIGKQKEELERRNIKIMDSLRYAETIQKAILPEDYKIRKAFDDFFVLYRPKDIVSGDFYWFSKIEANDSPTQKEISISAVIDCTGHGVPGAFMSLIGNAILNEIVNEKKVTDGKLILEMLNEKIYKALKQEHKMNTDGMDMCLVTIEKEDEYKSLIKFSGAKRPLFIFQKETGKIEVLQGARKSIGGKQRQNRFYITEDYVIKKGDVLYLTTDGLADQNNPSGDKFGRERLLGYLQKIASDPLNVQKEELEDLIERYQRNVEQRDDITVMGIKV